MSSTSDANDRRIRRWALAIVVLGFVLRLAFAVALGLNRPPQPGDDAEEYDTYAWNVAQGRGYRGLSPDVADQDHLTAFRPPGPSLVWAGLYAIAGHRYDIVRVAHCAMGAWSVWLVFVIGRRAFGPSAGLLAALGYAVFPTSLQSSTELLSEPLGTLLLLGLVASCLRFADRPTWGVAVGAGVLYGLNLLTRANTVVLAPFLLVWGLWQFRGRWDALARLAALFVTAGVVLAPWVVRNYLVFHAFIPLSTMGGSALLQANNRMVATDPELYGYSVWDTELPEYADLIRAPNDELERDRVAGRLAMEWIRAHPRLMIPLSWNKVVRGLSPFLNARSPALYRWGMLLSWGPVLVLSVLAFGPTLWRFLRERDPSWILHVVILQYLAATVLSHGLPRYRVPIEPYFLILAAAAVIVAVGRGMGRQEFRSREPLPPVA